MKTALFGSMEIGRIPRVVGTMTRLETLQAFASFVNDCDIAEVRLDEIGTGADWLTPAKKIVAAGTPVILTLRAKSEGGKWAGPDSERAAIYKAALPYLSALDAEIAATGFNDLCRIAASLAKPIIGSFHDFGKTPSTGELEGVIAAKGGADVIKISTMIQRDDDVQTLRALLTSASRDRPLCVIGMGTRGTRTRTDFPLLGSCLTYGYLDAPSAPGQLPASALLDHIRGARETSPPAS